MDEKRLWANINEFSGLLDLTKGRFANISRAAYDNRASDKAEFCLWMATELMNNVLTLITEANYELLDGQKEPSDEWSQRAEDEHNYQSIVADGLKGRR